MKAPRALRGRRATHLQMSTRFPCSRERARQMDTVCLKETRQMKAEDITTIEDMRLWAVEHDANIGAWWEQQWKENGKMEAEMSTMETELRAVRSKVVWANGAVTVITSFCGALLAIAMAFWKMQ